MTTARTVEITLDGRPVRVAEGATLLQALRQAGLETPTLCYFPTLAPANACRVCVVEVEGSRALVPACSRAVEAGMKVSTDSERVRLSRRLVLELLASSVDLATAPEAQEHLRRYEARPERFGAPAPSASAGHGHPAAGHHEPLLEGAATVRQPVKDDNDLYVRDYSKCILCYRCVQACGTEAQNTFAIAVAGRGFEARISTEFEAPLPDSACVYCGNCIGVCPTGALMFRSEHHMRASGAWDEARQTATDTICAYCGVGCTLTLHVQDNAIVKVTSPHDHEVARGHLCVKGRFGWQFVQNRAEDAEDGDAARPSGGSSRS